MHSVFSHLNLEVEVLDTVSPVEQKPTSERSGGVVGNESREEVLLQWGLIDMHFSAFAVGILDTLLSTFQV